jgi:CheY-like chemotaxis protein
MARLSRRRIVVVDDDRAVLGTVQRLLEALGWDVYPAQSGGEALAIFGTIPEVEILLTDVDMPGIDGVALGRQVLNRFPGTAVVLMSGGTGATIGAAGGSSSSVLLRKPFTRQALAAVLDTIVGPDRRDQERA